MDLPFSRSAIVRALIVTWLVTAVWDFACATALSVFAYNTPVARFWLGIGMIAFGQSVPMSGVGTMLGIVAHLLVALGWSLLFVMVLVMWPWLRRVVASPGGAVAVACAYGPLIWLAMSFLVIPQGTGRPPTIAFRWWVQIFAHVPFVTLPMVFTARRMLRLYRAG